MRFNPFFVDDDADDRDPLDESMDFRRHLAGSMADTVIELLNNSSLVGDLQLPSVEDVPVSEIPTAEPVTELPSVEDVPMDEIPTAEPVTELPSVEDVPVSEIPTAEPVADLPSVEDVPMDEIPLQGAVTDDSGDWSGVPDSQSTLTESESQFLQDSVPSPHGGEPPVPGVPDPAIELDFDSLLADDLPPVNVSNEIADAPEAEDVDVQLELPTIEDIPFLEISATLDSPSLLSPRDKAELELSSTKEEPIHALIPPVGEDDDESDGGSARYGEDDDGASGMGDDDADVDSRVDAPGPEGVVEEQADDEPPPLPEAETEDEMDVITPKTEDELPELQEDPVDPPKIVAPWAAGSRQVAGNKLGLDSADETRLVNDLLRNNVLSELGGLRTARPTLRRGSGVG